MNPGTAGYASALLSRASLRLRRLRARLARQAKEWGSIRTSELEPETTPQVAGQSGFQWRDQGTGLVFIADDEGNSKVTQNSENYAFGFFQSFLSTPTEYGLSNGFLGPAQFDIILQALDGGQIILRNHIVVNVRP